MEKIEPPVLLHECIGLCQTPLIGFGSFPNMLGFEVVFFDFPPLPSYATLPTAPLLLKR